MKKKCDFLVSIIVPIYNVAEYVEKCVESILKQTYPNLEVILVDDGSTDGSAEICDKFANIDNRVQVVHKVNGGLVSARKAGAMLATGDYVINVDGDDWIEPHWIQDFIVSGKDTDNDVIIAMDFYKDYKERNLLIEMDEQEAVYKNDEVIKYLSEEWMDTEHFFKRRFFMSLWSVMIKREIYAEIQPSIDDEVTMGEDFFCVFQCILKSNSIALIRGGGYHYVQREGSMIHEVTDNSSKKIITAIQEAKKVCQKYQLPQKCIKGIKQYLFALYIISDYGNLLLKEDNFLLPYPKVKAGSEIIVYGAGNIGQKMVSVIDKYKKYKLVALVDKYAKSEENAKIKIDKIDAVKCYTFDYIVIALLNADMARQAKRELLELGVEEHKIALMDARVLEVKYLPE